MTFAERCDLIEEVRQLLATASDDDDTVQRLREKAAELKAVRLPGVAVWGQRRAARLVATCESVIARKERSER